MKYLVFILFFVFSGCYIGDELPPDQKIWEYELPSDNGLIQNELLRIDNVIKNNDYQIIEGLIIIKDNKLVFENYYDNGASRIYSKNLGSAGLSITSAAVGIALDQQFFQLNDPINQYLSDYELFFIDDPNKANITIRHLLTHRSGLSWNETIEGFFSPENNLNQMKSSDDWVQFVLNQPLEAPPGLRFSFNTAGGVLLAKIIENATGQSFESFLKENLLNPLTIETLTITRDLNGSFNAGDGFSLSLLDWTKLSYLFLQRGIWQGRKIIDPNFVEESISEQFQISNNERIGYLWSLFGDNFQNQLGIDHTEVFFMMGELGQSQFIIPSENMIVSILADNFFNFNNLSLNLFAEITYTIQSEQ